MQKITIPEFGTIIHTNPNDWNRTNLLRLGLTSQPFSTLITTLRICQVLEDSDILIADSPILFRAVNDDVEFETQYFIIFDNGQFCPMLNGVAFEDISIYLQREEKQEDFIPTWWIGGIPY